MPVRFLSGSTFVTRPSGPRTTMERLSRPLHHDALDQGLTADERFKFFLADRIVLFFHANLLFFPGGDADRDKRSAALRVFQRQRAAVHGDDLLAHGEADAAAARLGAALIEF